MAAEAGLDLVEISPNYNPPVCKILDYGKYKYQAQKKAAEARKKQKVVEVKEIKFRPMIDDHDYDVKMRSMQRFFEEGDKVKVTLRFRGREMAHQELGTKLLDRVKEDISKIAKVESEPRFEGRQMIMILAPRYERRRSGSRINKTPATCCGRFAFRWCRCQPARFSASQRPRAGRRRGFSCPRAGALMTPTAGPIRSRSARRAGPLR